MLEYMKLTIAFLLIIIAFLLYNNSHPSCYGGYYSLCKTKRDCDGGLVCVTTRNEGKQCRAGHR